MSNIEEKKSNSQYATSSVPQSERQSIWQIGAVCMGYVLIITSMQVGSVMGKAGDLRTILEAIGVGSLFMFALGAFMAVIACKTGVTFGLLTQYAYGKTSSKIIATLIAFTLVCWFSIDIYLVGQATNALFPSIPILPVVIVAGIAMTFTALYGMRYMAKLGGLSVPLVLIFGSISMFMAVNNFGGLDSMFAVQPKISMSFSALVALVIGSWVGCSITLLPDIMRFAKNRKQALIVTFLAIMIGNPLMILVGAVGTIATGEGQLNYILVAQGLIAPGFILMWVNNWSVAQGCAYSGALTMGSVTKLSHKTCTVCFGILGIIMAAMGFYDHFGSFVNFLASTVPAVGGVLVADYLVTYRHGYNADPETLQPHDVTGILAFAIGVATAYSPLGGIVAVNSLVAALIARAVLSSIFKKAVS